MMPSFRFIFLSILFVCNAASFARADENPDAGRGAWLFAYFTGGGRSGLHLAWSRDGLNWTPLKNGKSFLTPPPNTTHAIRDPSIHRAPDGTFHLVWTGMGYASSRDLIEWSDCRLIPVMQHEPTSLNIWAPELFYERTDELFYIIWSSTIPERYTETAGSSERAQFNHRMYYTTTKDFKTFSATQPYWNPGHNVIDGFLAEDEKRYLLFYKDETMKPEVKKTVLLAIGDSPIGPFHVQGTVSHKNWVEGPAVLKIGDFWILYYDCYQDKCYGAVRSADLKTWENISDQLVMPPDARHGTMFPIDEEVLEKLQKLWD